MGQFPPKSSIVFVLELKTNWTQETIQNKRGKHNYLKENQENVWGAKDNLRQICNLTRQFETIPE